MFAMERSEMTKDRRWWKVAGLVVPVSLLATAVLSVGFNLIVFDSSLSAIVDTFFVFAVAGPMFFGVAVWLWGVAIGWLVWPVVWNLQVVRRQREPIAAAISAFVVAIFGGVIPFGSLAYPELNSIAGIFLIPAVVATVMGPMIAFLVYGSPEAIEK
ncbi:hypothetical protein [Ascidiaceihabitans sp.]|uniref:hypothetical protein n=1 Tax=Ascidiaceihabitans sp. TaxID=1872644 RepID=UPI003299502E